MKSSRIFMGKSGRSVFDSASLSTKESCFWSWNRGIWKEDMTEQHDNLSEPTVDLALALHHGMTEEEYGMMIRVLGRVPTYTELGIFSVMWSEHCSYKNSIAL